MPEEEHSEWTGKRGMVAGFLLGNRLFMLAVELAFGPAVSAVSKKVAGIVGGDETILDVGCGSGGLSLPLARKLKGGRVICLDLSDEMLAGLKSRARKAGLENRIQIIKAPASKSGLEGDSVDIAVSNNVFHELDEPAQALAEQLRVLKSGGHLVFSDFRRTRMVKVIIASHHEGHGPYEAQEVESLLKEAGFRDVEVKTNRHRLLAYALK